MKCISIMIRITHFILKGLKALMIYPKGTLSACDGAILLE